MSNALVPELAITDYPTSRAFYCEILGFNYLYERPEEGFGYLRLGTAELMLDQIGAGRTFDAGHRPSAYPFGKGINLQIRIPSIAPLHVALSQANHSLVLPLEDKWYRIDDHEEGNRQLMIADPDGYLLRFYEDLGRRPIPPARDKHR
ncbi:bleomycin resistance protein [Arenibacterium sp. LLYu02]|uniref:bleomycin resistance protein n=1 Tax=Arenibacterium sp. LLYu02 TaxID=3404132 RepID=UPI003B214B72